MYINKLTVITVTRQIAKQYHISRKLRYLYCFLHTDYKYVNKDIFHRQRSCATLL